MLLFNGCPGPSQQVLDVSKKESRPDVVLKELYANLDEAAAHGDAVADDIKQ